MLPPMKARVLGGFLLAAGAALLILSLWELVRLSGAADEETIAHFGAMTDWRTGTYRASAGRGPTPEEMARDAAMIRKVAGQLQEGFVVLPWFKSYTYDRLRNLSHRLSRVDALSPRDSTAVRLIRDFADRLDYLLDYGFRTLVATTILGLCMMFGGGAALFTRYGRLGAPLVGIGTTPLFYLNVFDPVQILLIVLAVVLLFLAPSTGVVDRLVARFGTAETEKQLNNRMVVVGLLMLAFAGGMTALSFAVAEAIGAASFTVASGGIAYGLYLTILGLVRRARS